MTTTRRRQRWSTPDDFKNAILRTKAGGVKRRFTWTEKMRMLAPHLPPKTTLRLLKRFTYLFAPHRDNWIITRHGQGSRKWVTVKNHPMPLTAVVWHLLGDRVETRTPQWVGARPAGSTSVATIDLDPDEERPRWPTERELAQRKKQHLKPPLHERRRQVEDAFRRIDIDPSDPDQVLIVRTPRGGYHFILVFDGKHFDYQFSELWTALGLTHRKGHTELYPRNGAGVRLPFGYVPGHFDPTSWLRFIRRYLAGKVQRHNLEELYGRAERAAVRASPTPTPTEVTTATAQRTTPRPIGVPKHRRETVQVECDDLAWYERVIAEEKVHTFPDAERLMRLGIRREGDRTVVLKIIAEHLIWFRRYTETEAVEELTKWAFDPRHESKDIRDALEGRADEVTPHIERMCRWYATHDRGYEPKQTVTPQFAAEELDVLRPHLASLPTRQRKSQAQFCLRFLEFMKTHGRPLDNGKGWSACIAAAGVMRKWEGSTGKRYKVRRDLLATTQLLVLGEPPIRTLTKSGRAQEYKLFVPVIERARCTLGFNDALDVLIAKPAESDVTRFPEPPTERTHEPTEPDIGATTDSVRTDPPSVPAAVTGVSLDANPPECDPQRDASPSLPDRDSVGMSANRETVNCGDRTSAAQRTVENMNAQTDVPDWLLERQKATAAAISRLLTLPDLPDEIRELFTDDQRPLNPSENQVRLHILKLAASTTSDRFSNLSDSLRHLVQSAAVVRSTTSCPALLKREHGTFPKPA